MLANFQTRARDYPLAAFVHAFSNILFWQHQITAKYINLLIDRVIMQIYKLKNSSREESCSGKGTWS